MAGSVGRMPTRYRCAACGNLTRFDVVTDRRTRAFHHYSVGGALSVEEEQVLEERVVEVSCRWCGHGRAVEEIGADEAGDPSLQPSGTMPGTPNDGEPDAG
jgi:hypothetical protein